MRIWIDTMTSLSVSREQLEKLINEGHTLVVANTAPDILIFQDNIEWLENQLQNGTIIIEMWNSLDEMTSKKFYWCSCGEISSPAQNFTDAVKDLSNSAGILDVGDLVEIYGIPKGEWEMGPWTPPAPLTEEVAKEIGLYDAGLEIATATRSDIFFLVWKNAEKKVFDEYNVGYCRGLATQHCCQAILNSDGSISEI